MLWLGGDNKGTYGPGGRGEGGIKMGVSPLIKPSAPTFDIVLEHLELVDFV